MQMMIVCNFILALFEGFVIKLTVAKSKVSENSCEMVRLIILVPYIVPLH